jgi:hypothetical protein
MLKKLIAKWRMKLDGGDEITAMTIDIDQAEGDYIESVTNMPGSNSGIADYYRIRRLRRIADRMKNTEREQDTGNASAPPPKEQCH